MCSIIQWNSIQLYKGRQFSYVYMGEPEAIPIHFLCSSLPFTSHQN
jgi:hypothetical protein